MGSPQYPLQPESSRLSGFSDSIVLKRLERESNRLLLYGLFVAVLLHLALASLWTSHFPGINVERPLEVKFRFVPPRMTKPFQLSTSSLQRHRRERIVPRIPSILPHADYNTPDAHIFGDYSPVLEDSLLSEYDERIKAYESGTYVPGEFNPAIPRFIDTIKRYSGKIISLKEELLTIDDLDHSMSEQYKGLLVYNPNDPNALTGYLYLPHVYALNTSTSKLMNISPRIIELATALNAMTGIKAKVDHQVILPPEDMDTILSPFLYIGVGECWDFIPAEAKAVADYVYDGGFVMFENLTPNLIISPAETSLRKFIKDAFGSKERLEIIPDDHPIYHTLFDFDDGPPRGAELDSGIPGRRDTNSAMLPPNFKKKKAPLDEKILRKEPVLFLEGIFIDGRLAVIYTNKGYSLNWGDRNLASKMGVNIVLYAMSQMDKRIVSKTDYSLPENMNMKNSSYQPIRMKKNDSLWEH